MQIENGRIPLNALIVEDSEDDTLLLVEHMEAAGFQTHWKRVDNERDMNAALAETRWEVVFSDYTMPRFTGDKALEITRRHDPDLPFIFVSGTIGEEAAVAAMRAGAQDYVMKHNLPRLPPTVRRELEDARVRRERRRAEAELRKLSLAVEHTADSIFITDPEGRIEYVNPAFERLSGFRSWEVLGRTPALVKCERNSPEYFQRMWAILLSGEVFRDTLVNRRKDGTLFYEEKTITPLAAGDGRISHFVSTGRDVTDRIRAEKARARLVTILESTTDFVATADAEGRLLYLNRAGRKMLGLGEEHNIAGMRLSSCHSAWGAQHLTRDALPTAARDGVWEGENSLRGDPDQDIPVSQVILAHRGEGGELAFFSTIARDITERKRYETELRHQATHDSLTGLPNRTLLVDRLDAEISRAKRQSLRFALLFLDLDNFKRVNDGLGHVAGDTLLKEVARRLQSCLRPNDTICRYGGDEFVLLIGDLAGLESALAVINKLRAGFDSAIQVAGQEVYAAFSIGIALYPNDGLDAGTLLRNADTAMYRAKTRGRNQYQFYAPDMNAHSQELLSLETGLRQALRRGEFEIHYQPQFDLGDRRIVGCEALLRWRRPDSDRLAQPAEFVPLLEESGLILPVGEWVLRGACAQWRAFRKAGMRTPRIAVNLAARQFCNPDLVDMVARVLAEEHIHPGGLELEITESTVMHDPAVAGEILAALAALGVRLALDDFGTGYSSLAYLKRFPLDVLKIDAGFIRDLPGDANDAAITRASISLGHGLGLEVLAEGVESQAQVEFLREAGCDSAQGYFLGRPLAAEQMVPFS
jgi:diguanylate cyclase (GGDEF)-like protein/PAS domain S-box-containing protein